MRGARRALRAAARRRHPQSRAGGRRWRPCWWSRAASSPPAWAASSSRASTKATSRCRPCGCRAPACRNRSRCRRRWRSGCCEIPEVKEVFARTGTAEVAVDPMPPIDLGRLRDAQAARAVARPAESRNRPGRGDREGRAGHPRQQLRAHRSRSSCASTSSSRECAATSGSRSSATTSTRSSASPARSSRCCRRARRRRREDRAGGRAAGPDRQAQPGGAVAPRAQRGRRPGDRRDRRRRQECRLRVRGRSPLRAGGAAARASALGLRGDPVAADPAARVGGADDGSVRPGGPRRSPRSAMRRCPRSPRSRSRPGRTRSAARTASAASS